jgi:hypothetical protein
MLHHYHNVYVFFNHQAGDCQLASFSPFENSGQQNMCGGLGDGSCNIPVFVGCHLPGFMLRI